VCPADPTEHIGIGIYDATAYALAVDAITHPGPADPARIARTVCLDPLMPGIDPAAFPVNFAKTNAAVATTLATYPHVPAEPRLDCYVTATCRRSSSRRHHARSGSGNRAAAARRSP
jgi:hypothetical protein